MTASPTPFTLVTPLVVELPCILQQPAQQDVKRLDLVVIESIEQPRIDLPERGDKPWQNVLAPGTKHDHQRPPIVRTDLPGNETLRLEPVEEPRHARGVGSQPSRHLDRAGFFQQAGQKQKRCLLRGDPMTEEPPIQRSSELATKVEHEG